MLEELPWYAHHENLVLLVHFLAENGNSGQEVADAVEKPWKYRDEYDLARMAAS